MFRTAIVIAASCSALVFGCAGEPPGNSPEDIQEIIDNLGQAGFPDSEIIVADGEVYVGRDAVVSLEASREMLLESSSTQEQFRTTNLVSAAIQTICINGSRFKGVFSTALDASIENYNALNLSFAMRRTGRNTAGCDAVITGSIAGPTGGSSGFPSGGLPFGSFQVGKSLQSFAVTTIVHVITHELGHTVGLRHSDFFNRSISCGGGAVNEGDAGIGAILIPGTPDTAVLGGSVMNSCFRTLENGEFTGTDVTALQTLY